MSINSAAYLTIGSNKVNAENMGRPPLNMQRTYVNLSPETLAQIDAIVGEKQRARFIREAVDQALKMAELLRKIETDKQ